MVARRAITAGEEITFDYVVNTVAESSSPCNCGAAKCRGKSVGDCFTLSEELQVEYVSLLADWFVARHLRGKPVTGWSAPVSCSKGCRSRVETDQKGVEVRGAQVPPPAGTAWPTS